MSIAENLADVQRAVAAACHDVGRDPSEVGLIAVSKTHPVEAIAAAQQVGQLHFGENKAQELRDKAQALAGVHWHFIGHLQTNKAKYVAPVAWRVHAIDAVRQAESLASRAPTPLGVLVAVNVGHEDSKSGVTAEQALPLCEQLMGIENIDLKGLMCIPPYREDPEEVAPFFEELAALAAKGRRDGLPLTELSMGMSHDFPVAIRHGATWVRVGTAIFGAREYR